VKNAHDIWSKLTQAVVALVVLAALLLIGMRYVPLIQENERYRRDILKTDEQIRQQEEISKQLKAKIDALRNDPKTVERLAREKLGYGKTNETIIYFEPSVSNRVANSP
jgi:cell division protein FtsB